MQGVAVSPVYGPKCQSIKNTGHFKNIRNTEKILNTANQPSKMPFGSSKDTEQNRLQGKKSCVFRPIL